MRGAAVRLIGALGLVATLFFAAPQLAHSQQQRSEVTETQQRTPPGPEDLALPAPTRPGETLSDLGDGIFGLGGGGGADAGVDAGQDVDAGGEPRPPPPLDDASCSAGGGSGSMLAFLFAAGLLFRRRT